ncbi:MAG: endolytic transglycosylase MltG [Parcubacteria group bacterium]|nr:endolytic transglycosylase MltG [Parcubacteria group bacterium]
MDIDDQGKKWKIALLIIAVLGSIFIWQGNYITGGGEATPMVFVVNRGEGMGEIADNLKSQDLIKSKTLFLSLTFLSGNQKNLMAGSYGLSNAMSVSEVLGKISSGDVIKEELVVIEGWDLRDIGWGLENKGMFMAEEVFEVAGFPAVDYSKVSDLPAVFDFSEKFEFLKDKPKNVGLEGYLFPDTYQLTRDEPLLSILNKMLANFDKKITSEIEEEIAKQGRGLFEVLTMASLLEKEVRTYEDKQIVAGILWKRLRNGWPLQVDATVTYLTGKKNVALTKDDLAIDSLYNTYKYRGLPLGPICNPGLDSIKAAVYYEDNPYWFYLTAKNGGKNGETLFSKTLEEHNINKYKYLK